MNKIEEKLKALLGERETIINEMTEIKNAYDVRQQRLVEIVGSIKTLQELMKDDEDKSVDEKEDVNTTEK